MTISQQGFQELQAIYPCARILKESNCCYIYFSEMNISSDGKVVKVEALLDCTNKDTKLYLGTRFPNKGQNWTEHAIIGKKWHTFSYSGVSNRLRLIDILADHLRVLE